MLEQLPEFIDPLLCAENRRTYKGEMALSAMPRLADVLGEKSGTVTFSMAFDKQGRLAVLKGHLSAVLRLVCQNCLDIFDWPVDIDFNLGIVESDEESALLPDAYEPLLVRERKTSFKEIIEEELLLTLPAFPKHAEGNCFINNIRFDAAASEGEVRSRSGNPFSVLAKLKNTGDS
jgi:uncharacterized protein